MAHFFTFFVTAIIISPIKLKLGYTKQPFMYNNTLKHGQQKNHNRFEKGAFLLHCVPCMEHGAHLHYDKVYSSDPLEDVLFWKEYGHCDILFSDTSIQQGGEWQT